MVHSLDQCLSLLNGTPHFTYYKILRKITPSLNSALLLSYFLDQSKDQPDNHLKLSYAEISDAIGLSIKEFKKAKQQLVEENLIKGTRKGFPGTVHYTLDVTLLEQKLTNLQIVPLVPTETPVPLKTEQNQNSNPVGPFGTKCNANMVPKGPTDKGQNPVNINKNQTITTDGTKGTNTHEQMVPKGLTTEVHAKNKNKEIQVTISDGTFGTNWKEEDIYIYNNIYKYIYIENPTKEGTDAAHPCLTMQTAMIEIWKKITECSPNENFPRTTKNDQRLLQFLQFYCKNSLAKWHAYCMLIASSKFLMGDKTSFKANLLWALYPNNWQKVWDGKYGIGDRQPRFRFTEIAIPSTPSKSTLPDNTPLLTRIEELPETEEAKNFRKHILDKGGPKLYSQLLEDAVCSVENSDLSITMHSRHAVRLLAQELEVQRFLPNRGRTKLKDNLRFNSIILNYPSTNAPLQITIFIP